VTAEAASTPVRRRPADRTGSPLEGYVDRFAALAAATRGAVGVTELPAFAHLALRADPQADVGDILGGPLPPPGHVIGESPLTLGLGPDEWLVLAPDGTQTPLTRALHRVIGANGAVVDVSGQRTVVELSGPWCRTVLAKGCAIDLHPRSFTTDQCAQTLIARAQVILLARSGDPSALWLLPRASFARYVADWLLDAALEYQT